MMLARSFVFSMPLTLPLRVLGLLLFLSIPACRDKPVTLPDSTPAATEAFSSETRSADARSKSSAIISAGGYEVLEERADRVIARLPNRMILVAQSLRTAPVVSAQVWIKTGSLYEQEHVGAGLSHFLEHLISGGSTTTRPESESTAMLGRIGAGTNAATSLDTVRYYINTTAEHSETAIDLLSDWMQNSVITDEEYARERDVIQSEFSMGQGEPSRIFWKLTQQARFAQQPEHPGAHPTIGYLDEFLTVTRDQIYAFYKRMYVPNNMVMVVVGDVDPYTTIERMASRWADVPAVELPELSFPASEEAVPAVVEGVATVARPRERLMWPGVKLGAEHDFALDLLAAVLGGGESSRLVRELRDQQQRVTTIDAFNYSAHWGPGFFGIDYELADPAHAQVVRDAVAAQLDRLRVEPVTEAELDRVKRRVLAAAAMSGQTAAGRAGELASDIIATADPDYHARYAKAVQELTSNDLMVAAGALLNPDHASRVVLRPAGADDAVQVPTRPAANASNAIDGPGRERINLDNQRLLQLLALNVNQQGAVSLPAVVEAPEVRTLGNGLTVVVQRSTNVPAVSMQLYSLGGLLADSEGREGLTYAAYAMLMRGTQKHSAHELAEAIEDLGATLSTGSGNNTAFARATALAGDWSEVMTLMAEVLTQPAFDEDQWHRLRPRLLASIDRSTDRWSGELNAVFREAYFGNHAWSQMAQGRREAVESFGVADLREAHGASLVASASALAVVGDVDPEVVFAQAQQLFGHLPTGVRPDAWPQPAPPVAGLKIIATEKPVAAVKLGYGPGITRDHADYPAVMVLSRVLGDFPSGWLPQELRGRDGGLAYASGAGVQVGIVPGYFAMIFNAQATTVTEALRRTVAVANRARKGAISQDDLERAKSKVLTNTFQSRQSNADLAAGLALDHLYGIEDLSGATFRKRVQSLDAKQLQTVARRTLSGTPTGVLITGTPLDEDELKAMVQ